MSKSYGENEPISIAQKKEFLKEYKIALWDVVKSCKRENSLDSNLKEIIPNDINALLKKYPNIEKIYFTSKFAQKVFDRYFDFSESIYLPSPSPAFRKMSFEKKLEIYKKSLLNVKICEVLELIKPLIPKNPPSLKLKTAYKRNPYTILMSTLLSLRSKDENTAKVASVLFNDIQTPHELLQMPTSKLEEAIKPIGMQKQKAKTLREVSKELIERFNSQVPSTKEELLSLKGVGEKSGNILLNSVFNKNVIAVDTHVHRICNLLGFIETNSDKDSSTVLNTITPKECKSFLNDIIVSYGQTICKVKSPKCPICPLKSRCGFKSKS